MYLSNGFPASGTTSTPGNRVNKSVSFTGAPNLNILAIDEFPEADGLAGVESHVMQDDLRLSTLTSIGSSSTGSTESETRTLVRRPGTTWIESARVTYPKSENFDEVLAGGQFGEAEAAPCVRQRPLRGSTPSGPWRPTTRATVNTVPHDADDARQKPGRPVIHGFHGRNEISSAHHREVVHRGVIARVGKLQSVGTDGDPAQRKPSRGVGLEPNTRPADHNENSG